MNKILLAQKTVQALIQMCTGNYKNQEIAFRSQVIVSVNVILAITAQQPGDLKVRNEMVVFNWSLTT